MFRQLFGSNNKVDVWTETKVPLPRSRPNVCSATLAGMTDGLIVGFVIGGILGIMQAWVSDAKPKDMCLTSGSWAFNGAAIGAIAMALGNAIVHVDTSPGSYVLR